MQHYAAIKERLVAGSGVAIIGMDDDYSASDRRSRPAGQGKNVIRIASSSKLTDGVWPTGASSYPARAASWRPSLTSSRHPALRGDHNAQNAAAAFAACRRSGLSAEARSRPGFDSFPGLAHRMEQVGRRSATCCSSTIPRRPMPMPRAGAVELSAHLLDRRRAAEGRRHRAAGAVLSRASPRPT